MKTTFLWLPAMALIAFSIQCHAYATITITTGLSGGTGYTSAPTVRFDNTGTGGKGATATATVSGGKVTAISMSYGGTGYTSAPTVVFTSTGTGGAGATATATISGGAVTGVTISTPDWQIDNGVISILWNSQIGHIWSVTYDPTPAVSFEGGGGTGATATATVSGGVVTGLTLNGGGTGYTSAPTVAFIGGGGNGASASATISSGAVAGLTLTAAGSGYVGTTANLLDNTWTDSSGVPNGIYPIMQESDGDVLGNYQSPNYFLDSGGAYLDWWATLPSSPSTYPFRPFSYTEHWIVYAGDPGVHAYLAVGHQSSDLTGTLELADWDLTFNQDLFTWDYTANTGLNNIGSAFITESPGPLFLDMGTDVAGVSYTVELGRLIQNAALDLHYESSSLPATFTSLSETKYDYGSYQYFHKVHGVYGGTGGASPGNGAWVVYGSHESEGGGPEKQVLVLSNLGQWDSNQNSKVNSSSAMLLTAEMFSDHWSYGLGYTQNSGAAASNRIFGPVYFRFNTSTSVGDLYDDALNAVADLPAMWDSDSELVSSNGYVTNTTATRGKVAPNISGGGSSTADTAWSVLSDPGTNFQLSNTGAQYWVSQNSSGTKGITNIIPGTYRLSDYVLGEWGEARLDGVVVSANNTASASMTFNPENFNPSAAPIWTIGTPTRSADKFFHGLNANGNDDREYWGTWNYWSDFANTSAPGAPVYYATAVGMTPATNNTLAWNFVQWHNFNPPLYDPANNNSADNYTTQDVVFGATLNSGGSGYTSAPTVTFSSGGGTGASAQAVVSGGSVYAVAMTGAGVGYTSLPTISFSGGGGSGASATATLNAPVFGVMMTSGGGYTLAPTVTFSGGGGSGATATALVGEGGGGQPITGVTVTGGGGGYTSAPSVIFGNAGTGGTGATAEALISNGAVVAVQVTSGSGYTGTPTVTFNNTGTGGRGAAATATADPSTNAITGVSMTNLGSSYTSAPTVTFSGGTGATASVDVSAAAPAPPWQVYFTTTSPQQAQGSYVVLSVGLAATGSDLTVSLNGNPLTWYATTTESNGTGYTSAPTVAISGGSPAATAQALITNGMVTGVQVSSGSSYSIAPTVTISGGGGSGATALATVNSGGNVVAVQITNGGGSYTSAPTVTFSGGGSGATATAVIGDSRNQVRDVGKVIAIEVTSGSYAANSLPPTVTFSGGGGSGAAALATLDTVNNRVNGVSMLSAIDGFNSKQSDASLRSGLAGTYQWAVFQWPTNVLAAPGASNLLTFTLNTPGGYVMYDALRMEIASSSADPSVSGWNDYDFVTAGSFTRAQDSAGNQ